MSCYIVTVTHFRGKKIKENRLKLNVKAKNTKTDKR